MGFKSHAKDISTKMKGLGLKDLKSLLQNKHLLFPAFWDSLDVQKELVIVVDVSVLFYVEYKLDDSHETSVRKVGEILSFLAHCSFTVVPVCDGERSDTKLDSYKRRKDALKDRIISENARAMLYKTRTNQANLPNGYDDLQELNRKAKKKNRAGMKSCFPDDLQAWLHSNGSL